MTDPDDRPASSPPESEPHGSSGAGFELHRHWVSVLLLVLTVFTIGFGFWGFTELYIAQNSNKKVADYDWTIPVYRTVQLLILNSGTEEPDNFPLAVARMLAAATFIVLTAAVATRVFQETTQLPTRMTRTGHTVICGLGQIGAELLNDLRRAGQARKVVIIERDETNILLAQARRLSVDIVLGDATSGETLRQARAHHAATVLIVTGDDGANLETAAEIAEQLQHQPRVRYRRQQIVPLRVALHLQDVKLAEAYRALSRSSPVANLIDLSIFSVARTSATHVVTKQLWPYVPKQTDEVAHFVILGFGTMGRALAVTLARLGHFPNLKRNRFTIADHAIDRVGREFLSRFPRFTAWNAERIGVTQFDDNRDQWSSRDEGIPAGLASESTDAIDYVANAQFGNLPPDMGDEQYVQDLLGKFRDPKVTVKPVIFVCGQNDSENFHAAVRLRDTLDRHEDGERIPLFVWLPRQPALAKALAGKSTIIPFGSCRDTAGLEEVLRPQREQLARVVHACYEQRAVAAKKKASPQSWNDVREDYRESNRQLADHFDLKLAHLGWRLVNRAAERSAPNVHRLPPLDHPTADVLAQMEHARWVAERLMAGWRYTPCPDTNAAIEANKAKKLHHSLVPWDRLGGDRDIDIALMEAILAEAQKAKYRLEPLGKTPQ